MVTATDSPVVRADADGERRWFYGGGEHTWKVHAYETDGAFFLFEDRMEQGKMTPLHTHPDSDETMFMLEGEILMHLDGREEAGRRQAAWQSRCADFPTLSWCLPPAARMLCRHTPGCCEAFYWGASVPATTPTDRLRDPWTSTASVPQPERNGGIESSSARPRSARSDPAGSRGRCDPPGLSDRHATRAVPHQRPTPRHLSNPLDLRRDRAAAQTSGARHRAEPVPRAGALGPQAGRRGHRGRHDQVRRPPHRRPVLPVRPRRQRQPRGNGDGSSRSQPWECVVIGGGVRRAEEQLGLFERVINLVRCHAPDAAIAFNATPSDTYEAAARWIDVAE